MNMLTLDNLPEIFALFLDGMMIGALLSGLPFIIGYVINAIIKIAQDQ